MTQAEPRVSAIYRYPVKGMTPEALETAALTTGEMIQGDRRYAIENGPGRFDPDDPQHLPKISFLMLMRNERMPSLNARVDEDGHTLRIFRDGRQVAAGNLATPIGRRLIEQFLAAYMQSDLRGAPKIVSAPGHNFSDLAEKCLHIVNMESVREVERVAGRPIDPLRFRANLYIEGVAPWVERDWVGHEFAIGGATLKGIELTNRCEAVDVDPASAKRDMAIPALMQRRWQRTDFGIYATVVADGQIGIGDAVAAPLI